MSAPSLRDRVRQCSLKQRSMPSGTSRVSTDVALPADLFQSVFTHSVLIQEMRLSKDNVYKAIQEIQRAKMLTSRPPQTFARRPACRRCNVGTMVDDTTGGVVSCDHCGTCSNEIVYALSHSDETHGPPRVTHDIEELIDHYAAFERVSGETCERIKTMLVNFKPSVRVSKEELVAAAIICETIEIPNTADIESRMRQAASISLIEKSTPLEPTFACATCGTNCYSAKCARFHCRQRGKFYTPDAGTR